WESMGSPAYQGRNGKVPEDGLSSLFRWMFRYRPRGMFDKSEYMLEQVDRKDRQYARIFFGG
ncbi:MAG: hypothetical protein PUE62_00840, partial [Coriobacteriaceae bacterium]|nr:hypothetical protein [Coriobacteriaceae bacterium]